MRCARARDARNEKREAGIDCDILSGRIGRSWSSKNNLPVVDEDSRWQRRHGNRWQRHDSWRRRPSRDFTVWQRARALDWNSILEFRAAFKYVVRAPHGPHTGGEVWIKVAVKDRVAHHLVSVAAAVIDHL